MSDTVHIPDDDLPVWMKQARRPADWGLLLVVLFSLVMARHFFIQPTLPATNESRTTVYQAATHADALRDGRLYSRWSPYALGGYGAPIHNYEPPAPAYSAALLDVLFTADAITAVRLFMALCMVAAGVLVYTLVTQRIHSLAGVLAAVLYLSSPTLGLTVPHQIGDAPQMLALALLPALLWAVNRALLRHQPLDVLLIALTSAGLLLTSPRHWLMGIGLAVALLLHAPFHDAVRQRVTSVGRGLLLGAGVAAFYWVPAIAPAPFVQWIGGDSPAQTISLIGLLALPQPLDPAAMMNPAQFTLGWALIATTLASLVALRRTSTTDVLRFQAIFLLCGFLLCGLLLLAPAQTWLLGVIVLCLSVGSTACLHLLPDSPLQLPLYVLVLVGVVVFSLPVWISPTGGSILPPVESAEQLATDILARAVPADAAIPATIDPANFQTGEVRLTQRLDTISDPNNQVTLLDESLLTYRYQVQIASDTLAVFSQAYYPGWQARLNDEVISAERLSNGLLGVRLSAGSTGELVIRMTETRLQRLSWGVSAIVGIIIALVTGWRWWRLPREHDDSLLLTQRQAVGIGLVLVLLSGLLLNDDILTPNAGHRLADKPSLNIFTSASLELLAYDPAPLPNTAKAGDDFAVTLYWRLLGNTEVDYQSRLFARNVQTNQRFPLTDFTTTPDYPTSLWQAEQYMPITYAATLPDDTAPGVYAIEVVLTDCLPSCADGNLMIFFDEADRTGSTYTLPRSLPVVD